MQDFDNDAVRLLIAPIFRKTLQELRMLSSVTINCQVTKIVMNSGFQLSELLSVSQMSQVSRIALRRCFQNVFVFVIVFVFVFVFVNLLVMSCLLITLNKCLKGQKSLGLLLGDVLKMLLSLSLSLCLYWSLSSFCSCYVFLSL